MSLTDERTTRARRALPCPFCGNKKIDMETDVDSSGVCGAYVRCPKCSAMGPSCDDSEGDYRYKTTAVNAWNLRQ